MSESNVQLARRGYEAMLAGDFDVLAELLDPGVVWHGGDPTDPVACHNRHDALAFIRQARARGAIGELVDIVDAGDRVVVITLPSSLGAEPTANVSTFRDEKVIEMVHFPHPDDAIAAANGFRDRELRGG